MNKVCKICISLLLPVVLFASCRQDDAAIALPLEVSAEINASHTRNDEVELNKYDRKDFFADDEIEIKKGDGTKVIYVRSAAGNWKPKVSGSPMTTTGGETFTATFPVGYSGIWDDQVSGASFWNSNLLSSTVKADGNRVRFAFAHANCKITIIVNYEQPHGAGDAEVTGKGLRSGNKSEDETISLWRTSDDSYRHSFIGIFSPEAATRYTISVKDSFGNTKTYTEQGAGLTLTPGCNYQYTFTSTNELILTSVIVTDFNNVEVEDAGSAT